MSEQLDIFRHQPAPGPADCPDNVRESEPPKRGVVQLTELPGETFEDIFIREEER